MECTLLWIQYCLRLPWWMWPMKKLKLSSIWTILIVFEDPIPIPFERDFVKWVDSISWMANNTKKLLHSLSSDPHCWIFFNKTTFGKRNKVPQENIPTVTTKKVKEAMLAGVETALRHLIGSLNRPFYTRVQLWGVTLSTNTPGIPCIFYPHGRANICDDWLMGSSLEAVSLNNITLANHGKLVSQLYIDSWKFAEPWIQNRLVKNWNPCTWGSITIGHAWEPASHVF